MACYQKTKKQKKQNSSVTLNQIKWLQKKGKTKFIKDEIMNSRCSHQQLKGSDSI